MNRLRVTVNSPVSKESSLGEFTTQAAALEAMATYILASFPPHISLQIVRKGDVLHIYSVKTKMQKSIRHVTFTREMSLSIKEITE